MLNTQMLISCQSVWSCSTILRTTWFIPLILTLKAHDWGLENTDNLHSSTDAAWFFNISLKPCSFTNLNQSPIVPTADRSMNHSLWFEGHAESIQKSALWHQSVLHVPHPTLAPSLHLPLRLHTSFAQKETFLWTSLRLPAMCSVIDLNFETAFYSYMVHCFSKLATIGTSCLAITPITLTFLTLLRYCRLLFCAVSSYLWSLFFTQPLIQQATL